jgi:hypothetical protein
MTAHPSDRKLAWAIIFFAKNSITSITGIKNPTQFAHTIYNISIYISKFNTFIQTTQYPTHSFKLHNIHHIHTQHNIHRQDHKSIYTYKSKVNTCRHRHLVVPRIAASRTSSSGVVPRIAVGRASSRAIEKVVDEVICWVIRRHL